MGNLTLGNLTGDEVPEKIGVPAAWNALFQNFYGSNPHYQNTDLPFIEEWNAVIDEYSQIFSGITLALTTTTDALPTFTVPAGSPLLYPAPGFESDCGDSPVNALLALHGLLGRDPSAGPLHQSPRRRQQRQVNLRGRHDRGSRWPRPRNQCRQVVV